jgi:RNA polymerase sigma-70 factor (ECF subfamily)
MTPSVASAEVPPEPFAFPSASDPYPTGEKPEMPPRSVDLPAESRRDAVVSPTDDELAARAAAGDQAALAELLGRHERKLFRLAMRFVLNEYDAQEVVQEVFLIVWRKLGNFEGRAQVSTWLHRVTVNAALMFLRARRRHPPMTMAASWTASGEPFDLAEVSANRGLSRTPVEQLESAELQRELMKAIDGLPAGLRLVFSERLVEGRSTSQTAHALKVSTPVVKSRLHRARLRLRANMQGYRAQ